jgi:hypothetical protein
MDSILFILVHIPIMTSEFSDDLVYLYITVVEVLVCALGV